MGRDGPERLGELGSAEIGTRQRQDGSRAAGFAVTDDEENELVLGLDPLGKRAEGLQDGLAGRGTAGQHGDVCSGHAQAFDKVFLEPSQPVFIPVGVRFAARQPADQEGIALRGRD